MPGKRDELEQLSGQRKYPVIEFEDGTVYREESKEMAAKIRAGELRLEGGAQEAAVDRDDGAGDVGGALGAEEGDEVAVLLRGAEARGGDFGAGGRFGGLERAAVRRPAARWRSGRWRRC